MSHAKDEEDVASTDDRHSEIQKDQHGSQSVRVVTSYHPPPLTL